MNFVKTTALLTLMTLVVLFSATALGFDVISALFFAVIFNFFIYFFSGNLAIKSTRAQPIKDGEYEEVTQIIYEFPVIQINLLFQKASMIAPYIPQLI